MSRKSFFFVFAAALLFVISTGTTLAVMPEGAPAVAPGNTPDPSVWLGKRNYKPDELLVKFKAGVRAKAASAALQAKGGKIIAAKQFKAVKHKKKKLKYPNARMERWWRIKLAKGTDLRQAMIAIAANPAVEFVEPNYQVRMQLTPNDPRFGDLWGMHNIQQTGGLHDADIDAPEAWDIETGSQDIVVAVIDSGVDYTHEDLAANMWTNPGEIAGNGIDDDGNGYVDDVHGYDFINFDGDPFDDGGHGTHCAGTIAGVGNNGIGVTGVNWNARIMALKFLSATGWGSSSGAADSIIYATNNGAKILSNSWGGGGYSQAVLDAINAANDAGVLFVAAAGNHSRDNDATPYYPATYGAPNIVAVAATDHNDEKAGFSGYGAQTVGLGAPGVSILSTVPRGSCVLCDASGYDYLNGTSMATPHVSGAAALILAKNPALSIAELKTTLFGSVDLVPSLAGTTISGGRLNVAKALNFNLEFEVSISPASQSVLGGDSAAYSVTVTSRSATAQQVTLTPEALDPGISATLADTVLTVPAGGTASTTLTAGADNGTPRGTYPVFVSAVTGAGQTLKGATAMLRVLVPEYTVAITPAMKIIAGGETATYEVILTSVEGYNGAVSLSTASPDPLITLGISPATLTIPADGTASATLTATADAAAPTQIYTLSATASDAQESKTATTQLRVLDTDLVMASLTPSVTEIGVGASFTVDSVLANQGAQATETQTHVAYYLSADAVITTGDTLIGTDAVPAVAGNGSVNLSKSLTVPATLALGSYYVGAIADYSNLQPEKNEENNALAAAAPIQVFRDIDLTPTAFNIPAGDLNTGTNIAITATVANQGGTAATSFSVTYYLSTDAEITTSDTYLGHARVHAGIAGNGSWNDSRDLPISTGIAPGSYYIGILADSYGAQAETDESNNALALPVEVVVDADLTPTAFNIPPGDLNTGSSIAITATVANQGNSSTKSFYVSYYLSTDAEITTSDTYLGYARLSGGMAGNSSWNDSRDLTIPASMAAGSYYIGVLADAYGAQAETDESNNALALPVQVVVDADLTPTAFTIPPGDLNTGTSIAITATVANQGSSSTGYFSVGYYLSTDAEITTSDTYLGSVNIYSGIAGNSSWNDSRSLNIPAYMTPGSYYIGILADAYGAQAETDESNNTLALPVQVVADADLMPTAFTIPPGDLNTGTNIAITATVANQGNSSTGSFSVGYYLSTDAVITTSDTYLGSVNVSGGIAGNGSWSDSRSLSLSIYTAPGSYYIGILADAYNAQEETDEGNNAMALPVQVVTDADLTPTAFTIPSGELSAGSTIATTASVANQGSSSTRGFYVNYYLSTDAEITTSDTYLGYANVYSGVAGNSSWNDSRNLTIPANTAPGGYYIGILADAYNGQPETNENNNALANPVNVIQ